MKRILIIAPHPDDETLGVGGTISKFSSIGYEVNILVVSGHLPPLYSQKDYERTVKVLMSGASDPVITKEPSGAWTHDITNAALN